MRSRPILGVVCGGFLGGIILTALAQWLNPCIGASRFETCLDLESMVAADETSRTTAFTPCYLGVCDFFLPPTQQVLRISVLIGLFVVVGVLAGGLATRRQVWTGAGAALCAVLIGVFLSAYVYPYGFPQEVVFQPLVLVVMLIPLALGAFGGQLSKRRLTTRWSGP